MKKIISQNEARRLRKQVAALIQERYDRVKQWKSEYPGGVEFAHISIIDERIRGRLDVAIMLNKVLVAKWRGDANVLDIYAVEQ